jgi:hypothetical protein
MLWDCPTVPMTSQKIFHCRYNEAYCQLTMHIQWWELLRHLFDL